MFGSSRSGDITKLNTIAIVNTTNESLSSKGVLSERIHRAAGPELLHECRSQLLGMDIVSEINKCYYSIVKSSFLESSFPKTPQQTFEQYHMIPPCFLEGFPLHSGLPLRF